MTRARTFYRFWDCSEVQNSTVKTKYWIYNQAHFCIYRRWKYNWVKRVIILTWCWSCYRWACSIYLGTMTNHRIFCRKFCHFIGIFISHIVCNIQIYIFWFTNGCLKGGVACFVERVDRDCCGSLINTVHPPIVALD